MEKVASSGEQLASIKDLPLIKRLSVFVAFGLTALGAASVLGNCNNGSSINKESPAHTQSIGNGNCNNQNQINVEFPGNPDEIIPQTSKNQEISKVNGDNSAAKYLEGLFSKNGPMGKNYDPAVIATFWTLIGYPATTDGYQTEDSILAIFSSSYNQMTTNNKGFNNLSANEFCNSTKPIMSTNFSFEDVAIAKGTLITQIEAVTKNGKIDNIDLKSFNAKDNISGIVFKIKNKSALNGFITVVIDNQGNVWVTGIQPTSGGSSSNSQSKSSNQSQNNQSQNSSGGGGVTGNGKIQENLSGNSVGNSSGGTGNGSIGNSNESTSGTENTPSGGTSGGNIPTTTEAPTTTTTESPTTTTTSPVQKNPDPNQGGCTDPTDPTCQSGS